MPSARQTLNGVAAPYKATSAMPFTAATAIQVRTDRTSFSSSRVTLTVA